MTEALETRPPSTGPAGEPVPRGSRRAWVLLVVITFLNGIGMTIVLPVLPFVVLRYIPGEGALALWVGVIESVFALCSFLVAPLLGAISDRYGRRPIIIYSVLGAAAGYVLFGVGGALWVLVLARVVQGLAAGDMPALFGYVADITDEKDRAKRFGLLGALTGIAFMVGPALGGLLARVSVSLPMFATAGLAVLVALISLTALPESLAPENRSSRLVLADLHPFKVIKDALARPRLRPLLLGLALVTIPFMFFGNNLSVLALDTVSWGPTQVGLLLTVNGLLDIVIQGGLLAILLPRIGERGVVVAGIVGQGVGCLGLAVSASFLPWPALLAGAALLFAAGQGGMNAALDGLMSTSVGADEQGWLAGGISSLTSAIQMVAPLLAGWVYTVVGHGAPYWAGLAMIVPAAVLLGRATLPNVAARA